MLNLVKALTLWLLFCSIAFGQSYPNTDSSLTITADGYYLTVVDAAGTPEYVKIETVVDLRGDKPTVPGDPDEPAVDIELVNQIKAWALAVDDPQSAQAIAAVYAHIRGALPDGTLTAKTALAPLKQATDSALQVINSGKDWTSFRDKLTDELTEAQQRGKLGTAEQIACMLLSVQQGVELAADGSTAISMDKLVEIARRTNLAIDGVTK